MSRVARKRSAKSSKQSRSGWVLVLHNPCQRRKQSRLGAGTWRCFLSAQTAVYAAKPRLISVGYLPIAQSQDGSRALSSWVRHNESSTPHRLRPWPLTSISRSRSHFYSQGQSRRAGGHRQTVENDPIPGASEALLPKHMRYSYLTAPPVMPLMKRSRKRL